MKMSMALMFLSQLRDLETRLRQTANVSLYHVTKFSLLFVGYCHYDYTKIGRFTPVSAYELSLAVFSCWFPILRISQL